MSIKKYHVSRNLFDPTILANNYNLDVNTGLPVSYSDRCATLTPIDVSELSDVTITYSGAETPSFMYSLLDDNNTLLTRVNGQVSGKTINVSSASKLYICFYKTNVSITSDKVTDIMLNTGSQPLPYEPYGNTWNSIPYRKYGTETDTLTSLPADVIADGQSASANIIGNMVQTGTPSPSSIIMPSECGDKTANLLDTTGSVNGYINASGEFTTPHANLYTTDYLPIPTGASSITQSYNLGDQMLTPAMCFYDSSKTFISGESFQYSASKTFQVPANAVYFRTCYRTTFSWCMVNTGSTALPYQPYGFQIPILSGGTTTNVYLGEVQSTRWIKKLVLTGHESWVVTSGSRFRITINDYLRTLESKISVVSHYESGYAADDSSRITNGQARFLVSSSGNNYFYISDTDYSTEAQLKTYLAQQYANGTPVTVWYVLATPTTGIVNEPLRKIGTYADSISNVTQIPTTSGSQTFDVDTTLKPSEVDLTYHGWHEHEPKEYSGGSWTG